MLGYLLRRFGLMIPTVVGITLLLFVVARMDPGLGAGGAYASGGAMRSSAARAAAEAAMKRRLHLVDRNGQPISLPMQYALWLWDTVRGELGDSVQYNTSVADLIRQRLP